MENSKITAQQYDVPKLEFGKTYFIAYGGVTYGKKFTFTRKNRIELCHMVEKEGRKKKMYFYWVSKRYLKSFLKSGAWMSISEENDGAK